MGSLPPQWQLPCLPKALYRPHMGVSDSFLGIQTKHTGGGPFAVVDLMMYSARRLTPHMTPSILLQPSKFSPCANLHHVCAYAQHGDLQLKSNLLYVYWML